MTLWQDLRVPARLLGSHAGFTLGRSSLGAGHYWHPGRRWACHSVQQVSSTLDAVMSMVSMKTTHRLSLDASGVLNIVTTMTCNGGAPSTPTTGVQERVARNNSCENPRVGGPARSESG